MPGSDSLTEIELASRFVMRRIDPKEEPTTLEERCLGSSIVWSQSAFHGPRPGFSCLSEADFNAILACMGPGVPRGLRAASDLAASASKGLIAAQARQAPTALALMAPGRPALSFAELVRAIDRTVQSLAGAGIARGNRVAVALPNGPELALILLAVTDCATCVPLNPRIDEAYCRLILATLDVDALIVPDHGDSPAALVGDALGLHVLRVSHREHEPAGIFKLAAPEVRAARVVEPVQPDDVALILHTSATISRAKLVPITHRVLAASILKQIDPLQFTGADRCLSVTPMFTSNGVRRSLFAPLIVGGSLVCAPGFEAGAFFEWLHEFEPSYYAAGPAVHLEILAECERRGRTPEHSLRFVWSGATALAVEVQDRLERTLGVPAIQAYGMSEAGLIACNPLP